MAFASRYTWRTSSRVGARTSAPGPSARRAPRDGGAASSPARSRCMTGSRKASVFPLPVLAAKAALLPSSSRGTANCWIAVGLTWPSLLRAVSASGSRPILAHMADRQAEHRRDVGSVRSDRRDVVHSFHSSTRRGGAFTARFPGECDRTSAAASAGCSPSLTPCDHPPTSSGNQFRVLSQHALERGAAAAAVPGVKAQAAEASSSEAGGVGRSRRAPPSARLAVSARSCERDARGCAARRKRYHRRCCSRLECAVAIAALMRPRPSRWRPGWRGGRRPPTPRRRSGGRHGFGSEGAPCARGCSGNPSATSVAPALAPAGATTSAPRPAPSPSPRATATATATATSTQLALRHGPKPTPKYGGGGLATYAPYEMLACASPVMYPLVAPPATCASRCGAAARTLVGRAAMSARRPCCRRTRAPRRPGWRGRRRALALRRLQREGGPRRAFFGLPRASRDPRRVARANRARGGSVDAGGPRRRLARRARRRVAGRSSRDDVSLRSVGSVALAPQRARGARPGAGRVASRAPASPTRQPCGSRLPGVRRRPTSRRDGCAASSERCAPRPPRRPRRPRRRRRRRRGGNGVLLVLARRAPRPSLPALARLSSR